MTGCSLFLVSFSSVSILLFKSSFILSRSVLIFLTVASVYFSRLYKSSISLERLEMLFINESSEALLALY